MRVFLKLLILVIAVQHGAAIAGAESFFGAKSTARNSMCDHHEVHDICTDGVTAKCAQCEGGKNCPSQCIASCAGIASALEVSNFTLFYSGGSTKYLTVANSSYNLEADPPEIPPPFSLI